MLYSLLVEWRYIALNDETFGLVAAAGEAETVNTNKMHWIRGYYHWIARIYLFLSLMQISIHLCTV
jgi:hypothetical protein